MIPVVVFTMLVVFVGGCLFGAAVKAERHADCRVECRYGCGREGDPVEYAREPF